MRRMSGRDGRIEKRKAGVHSVGSQEVVCRDAVPALRKESSIVARSIRCLTGSCTSILAKIIRSEHNAAVLEAEKPDWELLQFFSMRIQIRTCIRAW